MIESKMVFVKGGNFMMGSDYRHPDEAPAHLVQVSPFYIGQYPVTQKEWESIMGSNPSEIKGDDLPVTNVSWNGVQEFIQKLNEHTGKQYRLPTEAEWEYAAIGGNQSDGFEYAGSDDAEEVAWYAHNSLIGPRPVGQKKPNELEIYDMSGNVCEWCQDLYGDYTSSDQINPKGPDLGSSYVIRGGSWWTDSASCTVSFRNGVTAIYKATDLGFRLVHDSDNFNQPIKSKFDINQSQIEASKVKAFNYILEGYQYSLKNYSTYFNDELIGAVNNNTSSDEFLTKFSTFTSELVSTHRSLHIVKENIDEATNITEILEAVNRHYGDYGGLDLEQEMDLIKILLNTKSD